MAHLLRDPNSNVGFQTFNAPLTLFSIAVIISTTALWSAADLALQLAMPVVVLASALLGVLLARQLIAERLAMKLAGMDAQPRDTLHALKAIALKLSSLEHRTQRIHPVTGFPTRERLVEAIDSEITSGSGRRLLGAIRLTDFDRLASFDPEKAHRALAEFACQLRNAVPRKHTIGQIDRDCFAIWFAGAPSDDLETVQSEFQAIAYVASQEITWGENVLSPTVNAVAVLYPDDGVDAASLLIQGAARLGGHERRRIGTPKFVEPPSREAAREAFALEQGLLQAIAEDQFTMVYQPVVDVRARKLLGAEALLRWSHPELGSVSPARFIPIAEAIGLSDQLGVWVLDAACKEARRWRNEGLSDLKVAVNLSARQLQDPALKTKISRTLERHRLPAQALELELTETAAMDDASRTLEVFAQLRAMGVSLAIDDFGAGYSSLSYLKNLPFDKLKIDREFVTDVDVRRDSRAICKAIIELGRGLDLLVLAEGAENAREVEALLGLGCNVFQGFHFSRPLAGDAFRRWAQDGGWIPRRKGSGAPQEGAISA